MPVHQSSDCSMPPAGKLRVTFKSVKPRQPRVPSGRSSYDESLQNEETSEVSVFDNNSCFSGLSYSIYLRFSDATGRRFVERILLWRDWYATKKSKPHRPHAITPSNALFIYRKRSPESLFQTPTPLLFQNF